METLQIKKSDAIVAHQNTNKKGKNLLENLLGKEVFIEDIRNFINTFDDVLRFHKICPIEFWNSCSGLEDDEIAYRQLKLIVKAYNKNEIPDYNNSNQRKYEPRFWLDSSGAGFSSFDFDLWSTASNVGAHLVYLNSDNLRDAVGKFLDIYERYFTNNNNKF